MTDFIRIENTHSHAGLSCGQTHIICRCNELVEASAENAALKERCAALAGLLHAVLADQAGRGL